MYHFTIIDEASIENEQKGSKPQEMSHQKDFLDSEKNPTLQPKTSILLQRYPKKNSGVRVFIHKD